MVAVKGLSTFKSRRSAERESRKSGGFKGLNVYAETEKDKIRSGDNVAVEFKRKSIPVKAETSQIQATFSKVVLNKLDKMHGKNINTTQTKVGRKVLGDISNLQGNLQKNETSNGSKLGKAKMEKMPYLQRASIGTKSRNASSSSGKLSMGTRVESQSEAVNGRVRLTRVVGTKDLKVFNGNTRTRLQNKETAGHVTRKSYPVLRPVEKTDTRDINKGNLGSKVKNKEKLGFSVGTKDLKVFNGNTRTRLQSKETVGHVTRESTRNYLPPQRKSYPVLKHVEKTYTSDIKKGNLGTKMKNKEKIVFSVKPKVGTTVVPQASNGPHLRFKHRASDSSIKTGSEGGQSTGHTKILTRRSIKPIVKITTIGIPKASRTTSVFSKPTSSTSLLSNKTSSNPTVKAKSNRRKSYTSSLIEQSKILKEDNLPEIYNAHNQLEVSEYVDEIYQHYWVTEARHQSLKNYMEIQTDITPQMRGILINWLIEVHLKFDLMQETLYLMVTLLDYYLSVVTIKKNEMQLVGLTALLLASKYEDFWHPKVMELISISAELYTREQMLTMETTILHKLNFRLNLPTPYVFMLRFLRAAKGTKEFESLAFFLIELCLVEYEALHYKPSLVCASAIYVARCTLHLSPPWTPLLSKHSHYQQSQIRECAEMILRFHQSARKSVLKVTFDKYMSNHNLKVASIRPLNRLPSP